MFIKGFFLSLCLTAIVTAEVQVETVTTHIPCPRGIVVEGEMMTVLSRGRVRRAGGVSADVNDLAGTLWTIDLKTGKVETLAEPTDPPFRLWDRSIACANRQASHSSTAADCETLFDQLLDFAFTDDRLRERRVGLNRFEFDLGRIDGETTVPLHFDKRPGKQ
jgi:hypothetical protein